MASQKKTKQKVGQFFTTNHKHILQDMKISPKIKNIIEPFCGDGDLVSFITSQTSQHSKAKIECYDIDPKKDFITNTVESVTPIDSSQSKVDRYILETYTKDE